MDVLTHKLAGLLLGVAHVVDKVLVARIQRRHVLEMAVLSAELDAAMLVDNYAVTIANPASVFLECRANVDRARGHRVNRLYNSARELSVRKSIVGRGTVVGRMPNFKFLTKFTHFQRQTM